MDARRKTLTTPKALIEAGLVDAKRENELDAIAERYAIAVSPALGELIDRNNPADPIARQFVPDVRELTHLEGESEDPIGDLIKSPVKGVVHRYSDRLLIKLSSVCAVYCRFCFRREMIGPGKATMSMKEFADALAYIHAHPKIWEVILTGGDPLALSPRRLAYFTRALATIPHVKVLRWHTRLPVAAPERVTAEMVKALTSGHDKAVIVSLHANHPRELTPAARNACKQLVKHGVMMVSQSVLLRGVNDNADTLEALMRAFVETNIKPYYLSHGDLAPGTSHFRTSIADGQKLTAELRRRLSGVALPTYVLDIPGAHGKIPIGPSYISARQDPAVYDLTTPDGSFGIYADQLNF